MIQHSTSIQFPQHVHVCAVYTSSIVVNIDGRQAKEPMHIIYKCIELLPWKQLKSKARCNAVMQCVLSTVAFCVRLVPHPYYVNYLISMVKLYVGLFHVTCMQLHMHVHVFTFIMYTPTDQSQLVSGLLSTMQNVYKSYINDWVQTIHSYFLSNKQVSQQQRKWYGIALFEPL